MKDAAISGDQQHHGTVLKEDKEVRYYVLGYI